MSFTREYPQNFNRDAFQEKITSLGIKGAWRIDHVEIDDDTKMVEFDAELASHDFNNLSTEQEHIAKQQSAKTDFANVQNLATVTANQAETWITNNVTDLATAKQVLIILAKMNIAIRNKLWPDLEGS